jgi:hypothetical protein
VENSVSLDKCSTTRILTRESHFFALEEERSEGKKFPETPIDVTVAAHLDSLGQQLLEFGMNRETFGRRTMSVADSVDDRHVDPGRLRVSLNL